ncbi:MAG: hypothetical protein ISN29_12590 [Gammaproteobacteria bacterium AqS3]|nr:hypothetical protein [Gammaproteobacteria bacterium AqS3]
MANGSGKTETNWTAISSVIAVAVSVCSLLYGVFVTGYQVGVINERFDGIEYRLDDLTQLTASIERVLMQRAGIGDKSGDSAASD